MRCTLAVPPCPNLAPEGVFDAYAWCASDTLSVLAPDGGIAPGRPLSGDNPPGFAFVFHGPQFGLPAEPGELHLPGLLPAGSMVLAPYAIDEATDGLYEQMIAPNAVFSLAVVRFDALYWALHDWCHFHNHGPFVQRAWTELCCDATALTWLNINARLVGLQAHEQDELARAVHKLCTQRFADEGLLNTRVETLVAEITVRRT